MNLKNGMTVLNKVRHIYSQTDGFNFSRIHIAFIPIHYRRTSYIVYQLNVMLIRVILAKYTN